MAHTNSFNVGDRVEYHYAEGHEVNQYANVDRRRQHNGRTGTITRTDRASAFVKWDNGDSYTPYLANVRLIDETVVEEDWS